MTLTLKLVFLGHEFCEMPKWWRFLWGTSFARCSYGDVFFSQISWHVPIFQTCEPNFAKHRTDTDTMFSLKNAQDHRLHFCREKFSKKFRLHGFFPKEFLKKTLFLTVFHLWSPISQNWDRIQGTCFRELYKRFVGYILVEKWRQSFVSYLVFFRTKKDKKIEKLFLIGSSYFSKLMKDTETVLLRGEQHWYRLIFGPTKLSSSSMTPSFFCQKTSIFFKFLVLFYLSSYIPWRRPNMRFMVSLILRSLCRLRFRLKTLSKFFPLWFF